MLQPAFIRQFWQNATFQLNRDPFTSVEVVIEEESPHAEFANH